MNPRACHHGVRSCGVRGWRCAWSRRLRSGRRSSPDARPKSGVAYLRAPEGEGVQSSTDAKRQARLPGVLAQPADAVVLRRRRR